jgi:hypothetical protein
MGRPRGAKNKRTLLREAEEEVDRANATNEIALDRLYVIERAMRHFFLRAETGKAVGRGQQQVDENFRQAAALAALAAPGISPTSIACPANATGTESGNGGRTGPFARKARRCIDSRANGVRSWRSSNRLPTRL